ncbi:MAG: ATP-binding protein [Paracoccaceae bacterium]
MKMPRSLLGRLALWLGVLLTLLWVIAASVTAVIVRQSLEATFDASLQETVQRILPLAVLDIVARDDEGVTQQLAAIDQHGESLTYIIRDDQGRILLQSHAADLQDFPGWDGNGFHTSDTHRFYSESVLQGTVRMTAAEPLAHRDGVARDIQMSLGLPLLIVIPLTLLAIVLVVRYSLAPLHRLRGQMATRGARDMSRIIVNDLPAEVVPVADALNTLLHRLSAAFDAERSFAANAAHELRTPLAGAIAQAQRLQAEAGDPAVRTRAADIEATLKRLTRLSERLLQLARAEGGRLRLESISDLRPVASILTDDLARIAGSQRISLQLPEIAVMSDLDPDAFAILYRNLVENALRHGSKTDPVEVSLTAQGVLTVANAGPCVPADTMARLTSRFERGNTSDAGSGLGLAIVAAIAGRIGARLMLRSPRKGQDTGFEVELALPSPTTGPDS